MITSMGRLRVLVRSVVGASTDSNAIAISLSSFLKDDRWPYFDRAAQRDVGTPLTFRQDPGTLQRLDRAQTSISARW